MGTALEIMEEVEGQILEVPANLVPFWPKLSCQLSTHGYDHAAKDMLHTGSNDDCERRFRGSGFRSHRDSEDPQSIHLNTLIQPNHSHVGFQDPASVEASDCRARSLPALRSRSLKKATVVTSGMLFITPSPTNSSKERLSFTWNSSSSTASRRLRLRSG
jgi:hypothetical protein